MKMLHLKSIKKIILLTTVLFVIACKPTVPKDKVQESNIPFEVLLTNSHSNMDEPKNEIITSSEKIQKIYSIINSTRKPGISVPQIDFLRESVAFINIGQKTSGGHSVVVTQMLENIQNVVIFYEVITPKEGEFATMVITTPFTVIKFPKQLKPVTIKRVNYSKN